MTPRILVLEDDVIAQNVLSMALRSRGYVVDVTADGVEAVQMMGRERYDLALMDYQLPELDGVSAARLLRGAQAGQSQDTKLIAITASAARLQERVERLSLFDAIVQKPFDVERLLAMVAEALDDPERRRSRDASQAAWKAVGLRGRPKAVAVPAPSREQAGVLDLYFDLVEGAEPDLILLTEAKGIASLNLVRARSDGFLLPIVDLTGNLGDAADAGFGAHDVASWRSVAAAVTGFGERRRRLSPQVLSATDVDTRLLAYLWVSDRDYAPVPDAGDPTCTRYPGFFPVEFLQAAERLAHRGLLSRRFADRFHCCTACSSRRLNVREECPCCRSANLSEVAIVHHFRCAHTGPETEFRKDADLVCPKCRQHLRHYGSDYDKPGHALMCAACGARNSEPSIGFSCLDCGTHTDGDAARQSDVFAYALDPRTVPLLTADMPRLGSDPVRDELLRLAQAGDDAWRRLAVVRVSYGARNRIVASRGEPAFEGMRALFLEHLHNALSPSESLARDKDCDYVVVQDAEFEDLSRFLAALLRHAGEILAESIEPSFELVRSPAHAGAA